MKELNLRTPSSLAMGVCQRWKTIFGDKLQSRKLTNQKGEVYAKSMAFNKMTSLEMPKG